jgi:hypothetical protein
MTDKDKKAGEEKKADESKKSEGEEQGKVELIHDVARGTKDSDKEFGILDKDEDVMKINEDGGNV